MKIDIEQMYTRYGPMVLRRCRQLLSDEHLAKDAMQEVFIQVIRKQSALTMEYPSSLLYRMATNISLNMIRSRKRRAEISHDSDLVYQIATDQDTHADIETRSLLDKIFDRERASTKVIAIYHFVDGLTLEQTAQEMNMSVSGIRKRLRQLKQRLQLDPELSQG